MDSFRDIARQRLSDAMPELRLRFGVSTLALFGSVARGDDHPGSDVDILVDFARPATLFDLAGLQLRLEDLLGRRVDIGTADGLRASARESALRELLRVA